jgi:hypothetical protein
MQRLPSHAQAANQVLQISGHVPLHHQVSMQPGAACYNNVSAMH